jgi:hypothetical protein
MVVIMVLMRLCGLLGGRGLIGRRLGEVLVVVHPHLEHAAGDADLSAEGVDSLGVGLVDAPAHAVRELAHPVLLLRRELGSEPLLPRRQRGRGGGPHGELVVVRRRRRVVRARGAAELLARGLG